MASKGHDFIVELVQIKMKQMGYMIMASDSHYRCNTVSIIPPTVLHHRPDVVGYNKKNKSVCIGEAKYYGDLSSNRSHRQISDYIRITKDEKKNITVVFGIPLSEQEQFYDFLRDNDLELNNKTILLIVPDTLIPKKKEKI